MVAVQTIAGPIDSADLGRTLAHEHICSGMAGMERVGLLDIDTVVRQGIEALTNARNVGIRTVIDCTPLDLGRQARVFERLAGSAPLQVIAATGVYRFVPLTLNAWNADAVARYFLRDLQDGMEGTGIRAGVIKLAWDVEYQLNDGPASPQAQLEKCARGAARAAKIAGVPILCHHRSAARTGHRLLDIFEEEGMDLRAVTIGHCNDSRDSDYVVGLAKRGATVGLDRFQPPRVDTAELERRSRVALDVVKAGFAKQMTLGHDLASFSNNVGTPEGGPRIFDPRCWTYVPEFELPYMLKHGATEANIESAMSESVRSMFEAAAAMRSS